MFSVAVYILLYATVSLFSKPFLGEFIKVFVAIIVSEVYPSVSDAPQTTSSLLALTETVPLNTTLYERPFARVISFVDLLYEITFPVLAFSVKERAEFQLFLNDSP